MTASKLFRVESFVQGLAIKAPCQTFTTGPITLSGIQTINTYPGAEGIRVLVKDQANPVENGVYTMETSAWRRDGDFDGSRDVVGGTIVPAWDEVNQAVIQWAVDGAPTKKTPTQDSITFSEYYDGGGGGGAPTPDLQTVTDVGSETTNPITITGGSSLSLADDGSVYIDEKAAALVSQEGLGQLWIRADTPNVLIFSDDAGNNFGISKEQLLDSFRVTHQSLGSSGGIVAWDYAAGQSADLTLTENVTAINITGLPAGGGLYQLEIEIRQDAASAYTIAWPSTVVWPGGTEPDLSTLDSVHLVTLRTRDGGLNWLGNFAENYSFTAPGGGGAENITLSGTSVTPNDEALDVAAGRVCNASWEFRNDGTVWYSINSVFTQFQDSIEWNDAQDTPTEDFWIRATLDSGSLSSGALGSWDKISGAGGLTRSWVWQAIAVDELVTGVLRIDIADDALGSNIVATGYYEGLAQRILS